MNQMPRFNDASSIWVDNKLLKELGIKLDTKEKLVLVLRINSYMIDLLIFPLNYFLQSLLKLCFSIFKNLSSVALS